MSRPALLVIGVVVVVLTAASFGYGFHRDELYFLESAKHLAWGYPDQPPGTPVLAWLGNAVSPGSLWAVRIPATVAAALTVLLITLTAREMGATRRGQFLAALATAVSGYVVITGHLLVTITTDLCLSAAVVWLAARLMRTKDQRLLVPIGAVIGIGLMNKTLIALLVVALLIGFVVAGPRSVLRGRWLVIGIGLTILLWLPDLIWQATHGWPQLEMIGVLAAKAYMGGRLGFIPFQFLLLGPMLAPVWIGGLVRLLRSPDARPFRAFAAAYLVMAGVLLVAGGTAYYLAAGYPALLAAGGIAADRWLVGRGRTWLLAVALTITALMNAVLGLPIVPVDKLADTPIVAVYKESGEQVGWPQLADAVSRVYQGLPDSERAHAVVVTTNYGEAGAISHFTSIPVYSGQNAWADWGRPPEDATTVIVLGDYGRGRPQPWTSECRELRQVATVDNGYRIGNDEQGAPIQICRGLKKSWTQLWPGIRHIS